ncbi:MAG: hypothetical protein SXV54_19920 [Chloroflexota bacterium]|nr:hypothetical protein [Chloroflexota bacterium]
MTILYPGLADLARRQAGACADLPFDSDSSAATSPGWCARPTLQPTLLAQDAPETGAVSRGK